MKEIKRNNPMNNQQTHLQRAKELSKQFTEYCNDGYNGGKEGLRCSTCDRKYRGEAAIIQLCPVCKADEIVTSTYPQAVEDTTIAEHKPRLELWNDAVEEGRRRERGFITKLIDGHKVVYKKGDERFYEDAKNGQEKDHIDSCCNETLDEILQSLKQTKN